MFEVFQEDGTWKRVLSKDFYPICGDVIFRSTEPITEKEINAELEWKRDNPSKFTEIEKVNITSLFKRIYPYSKQEARNDQSP